MEDGGLRLKQRHEFLSDLDPPTTCFHHGPKDDVALPQRLLEAVDVFRRFLIYLHSGDLPDDIERTDGELAQEYGLKSAPAIKAKRKQIGEAADARVERASLHLRAGWSSGEAITFVACKEEWRIAKHRALQERAA